MSKRELRRVGVLARVASEELKLVDAAKILSLSYRQAKRIWRRYEKEGAEGLKHRGAGRRSNRAKAKKVSSAGNEIAAEEILRRGRGKIRANTGQ